MSMSGFAFSSVLPTSYRDALEELLFFNPGQQRVRARIIDALEDYGLPEVVADGETLRVRTNRLADVQAVYVRDGQGVDAQLIGTVLFVRDKIDRLTILHLSVRDEYAAAGSQGDRMLAMRLINEVRMVGGRIRDVTRVRLYYGADGVAELPV